ncbi:MAG: carboxypeptidase-like regulatory domain-containing protein [Pseudohongiellaceae bacterium]
MIFSKILLSLLLFGVLFSVVGSHFSYSQNNLGSISGNLINPNGAIITGLSTPVFMTHAESGETFQSDVSLEGQYEVSGLLAGFYDLVFPSSCCMYRTYAQESVEIPQGQAIRLDLNLGWHINLGTIGDDPGMLAEDMINQSGDLSGLTPRMPDGKPDFSGFWYNRPDTRGFGANPPPLQEWAAAIQEQLNALGQQNSASYCLPQSAVPISLIFPYKIIHTDDLVVQLSEFVTPAYRQIFLDGRDIPDIWNPSWYGHSVGRWEGDTLIVESTGFNEITPGFGVHTEALKITERYTRPQNDILLLEIIAEDSEAYTEPYVQNFEARLVEGQEILEFVCAEGNDTSLYAQPVWRGRP